MYTKEEKIPFEIIIKPTSSLALNTNELWQYRELLYYFAWKEIKVRYKQAFLGLLWTVLQPLAMMSIFVLIFSNGLGMKTGNIPAHLYYLSGLLMWNLFNQSVTHSSQSMVNNANIIKKIYFPRLVIPISSILTASFDFVINLLLFYALLIYYHFIGYLAISWLWITLSIIVAYIICIVTAFGIGTFLSAINVKYRDVRYILPFFIQTLFFITPVMYDTSVIKQKWINSIIELNPLHLAITIVRNNINNQLDFHWDKLGLTSFFILFVMCIIGIFTFRKTEGYFADIV